MALTKKNIETIFARLSEQMPEPQTELFAPNPFCLLVAIVLSAQATDVGVNKATPVLFRAADTPEKMVALGEARIRDYIRTIGLFNNKAKNVWLLSQKIINEFDGEIPTMREALQTLPGVGRKTASVWVNCVLGEPTIAVDTHVFRVGNRVGLTRSKNPDQSEKQLENNVPMTYRRHAHHWLILHGRYVCKARKPLCGECSLIDICQFKEKILT